MSHELSSIANSLNNIKPTKSKVNDVDYNIRTLDSSDTDVITSPSADNYNIKISCNSVTPTDSITASQRNLLIRLVEKKYYNQEHKRS